MFPHRTNGKLKVLLSFERRYKAVVNLEQINTMQGVDIARMDKSQLTDVSGIDFDNSSPPQGERAYF
ncbi:hypothetical protein D3C74_236130 [compost metagenome]